MTAPLTSPLKSRKILLVEDDPSLGASLKDRLAKEYDKEYDLVEWAESKSKALLKISKINFDLLILDVGLPDGSGFEIAEHVQSLGLKCGLIFLTAQSDAESRLQGYELGAQEYIPKPFHLKELLMRVQHVLEDHSPERVLFLPMATVNFSEMKVIQKTGEIEYPPVKDLKVLELLVSKSPEPVSRDEILNQVWGIEKEINHRTVDNTIVRIKKIIKDEQDQMIRSVRGVGYQWVPQK